MRNYIISGCFLSCLLVALIGHAGEQKKQYLVECQMIRDRKVISSPQIAMVESQGASISVIKDIDMAGQSVKVGVILTATNSIQEGVTVLSGKVSVSEVGAVSKVATADAEWGLIRSFDWVFSIRDPDPKTWYSSPEAKDGCSMKLRVSPISDSIFSPIPDSRPSNTK